MSAFEQVIICCLAVSFSLFIVSHIITVIYKNRHRFRYEPKLESKPIVKKEPVKLIEKKKEIEFTIPDADFSFDTGKIDTDFLDVPCSQWESDLFDD